MAEEILTIGHSTLAAEEFLALLEGAEIGLLVDVRRHPGSRRVPWTRTDQLEPLLAESSIGLLHLPDLGGRRRPAEDSPNRGWRVAQFQGYADHMASRQFAGALDQLQAVARRRRTAMMCAEALWWRCHLLLIADALLIRGWRVVHVVSRGEHSDHELTDFAVRQGMALSYPPGP